MHLDLEIFWVFFFNKVFWAEAAWTRKGPSQLDGAEAGVKERREAAA